MRSAPDTATNCTPNRFEPERLTAALLRHAILNIALMETRQQAKKMQTASAARARLQSLSAFRLRLHADYQRAYRSGKKHQSALMTWFLAPNSTADTTPRVGLTVGKVIGKAHERNRIKRRMREVLRRHVSLLPRGCDLILHPRRSVLTVDFVRLDAEVVRILEQASAEVTRTSASAPSGQTP